MWTGLPEPQEGPQTQFLESEADIVVYGGAAGGGKTFGLLLDAAQSDAVANSKYKFVIFRRNSPQITNAGGLWDASQIYRLCGAYSRVGNHSWHFPSGANGRFAHLANEDDKFAWQGTEVAFIGFDELPHFTEGQFFYLLSRNRSMSGVPCKVRATCNPEPGWVKRFLAPWVDKACPDKAKSGEIRYFVRTKGQVRWVAPDFRIPMTELREDFPEIKFDELPADQVDVLRRPKSVTFIRSTVFENKVLLENDPAYLSNLMSLASVERARLLGGDWDVFEGSFFAEWGTDPGHQITPPHVGRLPSHWQIGGCLDANGIAKQFFALTATDELGAVHVIESVYREGLTPQKFCTEVLTILDRWNVPRSKISIAADPAMFWDNSRRDMIGEADIEVYHRAGLNCFEADNNRIHGWSRFHEWLQAPGMFHVWRGYNGTTTATDADGKTKTYPGLVDLFPEMLGDPAKPGDMLKKDMIDDPFDGIRYYLMSRPAPSKPSAEEPDLTYGLHGTTVYGDPHAFDSERWPEALRGSAPVDNSVSDF